MRPVLKILKLFFLMHKDGSDAGTMYKFFRQTHTHLLQKREIGLKCIFFPQHIIFIDSLEVSYYTF